jgi:sigma-B regulation protein RsbU (phosphoserine phosphatase)
MQILDLWTSLLDLPTSAYWPKLIVLLGLFFYIRKIQNNKPLKMLRDVRNILITLLIFDILYYFIPYPEFQFSIYAEEYGEGFRHPFLISLANGVVILFYLNSLSRITKRKEWGIGYLSTLLVIFLLGATDLVLAHLGIFRLNEFLGDSWNWFNWPYYAFYSFITIGLYVYMALRYYAVSKHNTHRPQIIIKTRREIFLIPFIFHLIAMFVGYHQLWVQAVLFPLAYLAHFYTLSMNERRFDAAQNRRVKALEFNIESVFEFMTTIQKSISENLEMDTVLDFVAESATKSINADGGAILLVDEFEDVLKVKAIFGNFPPPYQVPNSVKTKLQNLQQYVRSTPIPIGKTILGEVAKTGKPVLIQDSRQDERMSQNAKSDILFISSIMVIPLILNKKILGVLSVVSKNPEQLFTKEDMEHLTTFGDYTSLTINNLFIYLQLLEKQEMEREVGIAAEIQGQLLPSRLPRVSSIKMAAYSLPAKGVSGDYYDVIPIKKGNVMLVMCDVAGKGLPASLVMVMIRTIIHLVAHQGGISMSRIMEIVNWGVAGKIALDRFATMSLVSYNFYDGVLEYSNAAHHPLLIYRASENRFEDLDTEGIPIGLDKKSRYSQIHTKLEKGDIIMLYTDGIIEAMNDKGEQYTYERLEAVIQNNATKEPEELKTLINADVSNFVGKAKQHDDQTFLIMRIERQD